MLVLDVPLVEYICYSRHGCDGSGECRNKEVTAGFAMVGGIGEDQS